MISLRVREGERREDALHDVPACVVGEANAPRRGEAEESLQRDARHELGDERSDLVFEDHRAHLHDRLVREASGLRRLARELRSDLRRDRAVEQHLHDDERPALRAREDELGTAF